ncbi:MAG: NUDIX domain-containing protein, partial [candidate division NC10 bacterium]
MPLVIEVAAALIRDEAGRYLITQRRRGSHLEGLWEFPGGKREAGESHEDALRRELTEELSATFTVGEKFTT